MMTTAQLELALMIILVILLPLGWLSIFHLLKGRFKKPTRVLVIRATMVSYVLLVVKETAGQNLPVYCEIVFYLFIIFCVAVVFSLLVNFSNKRHALPVDPHRNIQLRQLLNAAALAEELGHDFYNRLAEMITDAGVKELCRSLAKEELGHKLFIEKTLAEWGYVKPDPKILSSIVEEMKQHNIYACAPDVNATIGDMFKYAIEQENRMGDFYLSFEESFPDEFKRMNVRKLAGAERLHAKKLEDMYDQVKRQGTTK